VEDTLVGAIGAGITMLLSTVITAFFIPNMLRKGAIDLLLAKPIHRSVLLIYKFIGGLSFMFLNTAFVVVGMWLVLGLRSGLWAPNFLLIIFILTFEFAIFYAVSALFGVLTRSPIVSILAACLTWVVLFAIGLGYVVLDATRPFKPWSDWVYTVGDTIHFVLPHYKDLDVLTSHLLARDLMAPDSQERKMMDKSFTSIRWGESLGVTTTFIAIMLGLSCWWFATRDY
jgi:ABC-type transport system involved in multi-copper enzyme maturation permease subunit